MTEPSAKQQADRLLSKFLKGQEVHEQFSEALKANFTIAGHTMEHWNEKFRVHIPQDDLNPQIIQRLAAKLMELSQEASFFYSVSPVL